jgi:predicted amidophosphoribosyltransferase
MICSNCGKEISKTDKNCNSCGAKNEYYDENAINF